MKTSTIQRLKKSEACQTLLIRGEHCSNVSADWHTTDTALFTFPPLTWRGGMSEWRVHRPGINPEIDAIIARRFGNRHSRPCNDPNVLTCAMSECQWADECRLCPSPPREGVR